MYGKIDCLDFLLERAPNYDVGKKTDKGNTALHLAVSDNTETESRKKCIDRLIGKGAEINESNNEDNTPLHLTARFSDRNLLMFIIDKIKQNNLNEEIFRENHNDENVFHMAACGGNKACLEHLFYLVEEEKVKQILKQENKKKGNSANFSCTKWK